MTEIRPCLWFDKNAQEAAEYYASVLPETRIVEVSKAASDYPSGKKGDVLQIELSLMGRSVTLLNGGPYFKLDEAFSFQIFCDSQADLDKYWSALSHHPESEQCGWVKDRFGLSWQIVPRRFVELMSTADPETRERVMTAVLKMKKVNVQDVEAASIATS